MDGGKQEVWAAYSSVVCHYNREALSALGFVSSSSAALGGLEEGAGGGRVLIGDEGGEAFRKVAASRRGEIFRELAATLRGEVFRGLEASCRCTSK